MAEWLKNLWNAQKNARDLEALRDDLRDWHQRINWELDRVVQEQEHLTNIKDWGFFDGRRRELTDASLHLGVNLDPLINPAEQQ